MHTVLCGQDEEGYLSWELPVFPRCLRCGLLFDSGLHTTGVSQEITVDLGVVFSVGATCCILPTDGIPLDF